MDINWWIKKFEAEGTFHDLRIKPLKGKCGKKLTARSSENIQLVQESVDRSPKILFEKELRNSA